jgi:hypothetical protein
MNNTIQNLGETAAKTAMVAAAEYLRVHKLVCKDYAAAAECIKSHIKMRLDQAMKDALECGMDAIAAATFTASMAEAGIEAAKEFGWPATM